MCRYTAEVIEQGGCATACQGCVWTSEVSTETVGTSCKFTWTVNRNNCSFSSNAEFTGTTTVPCAETHDEVFYCDSAGTCPGYKLSFVSKRCPIGLGGL